MGDYYDFDDEYYAEAFGSDGGDALLMLGQPIDSFMQVAPVINSFPDDNSNSNGNKSRNIKSRSQGNSHDDFQLDYSRGNTPDIPRGDRKVSIAQDVVRPRMGRSSPRDEYPMNNRHENTDSNKQDVMGYDDVNFKKDQKKQRPSSKKQDHCDATTAYNYDSNLTHFKKVSVKIDKHSLPANIPVITSQVAQDMKHPAGILKKQLDSALKKVFSYSKEKAELQQRLDSSTVEEELQRMRQLIVQQQLHMEELESENKSLLLITRNQCKVLSEQERNKELQDENIGNPDAQVKILLERVRRLSTQVTESRQKERIAMEETERFRKKNARLRAKNSNLNKRLKDQEEYNAENRIQSVDETDGLIKKSVEDEYLTKIERLQNIILKLQNTMRSQRLSLQTEIISLKGHRTRALAEQVRLENELEVKDSEVKSQAIEVKQLRKDYQELFEAHKRLLEARSKVQETKPHIPRPAPPTIKPPAASVLPTPRRTPSRPKTGILSEDEKGGRGGTFLTSD